MRLFIDLATGLVKASAAATTAIGNQRRQFGVPELLEIQWVRGGTPELHPEATSFIFGMKPKTRFNGGFLSSTVDLTAPVSAAGFYTGELHFDTQPIRDLLRIGSVVVEGEKAIDAQVQIAWRLPTETRYRKSEPFALTIVNSPIHGEASYV